MYDRATVLHADLDSFFASVEQRDDPALGGRPVIVGAGVVLAASYEARSFGVRGAMNVREARRRCPRAIVVPPRFDAYVEASRATFDVFRTTTPLVEGISIDEAFLEVGGLTRTAGSPTDIATRLRTRVADEVGLPITVGIARTKFLAKVASAVAKPDGLLEVPPDREREFLHPLPVERLWGVGPVTSEKLHSRGISTVGELAAVDRAALAAMLGPASGRHLFALAHLEDPRPVRSGRRRRSIGAQRALGRWNRSDADLDLAVVGLVDRITRRMRDAGRVGSVLTLRVRYDDFARASRSRTIDRPTAATPVLLAGARHLVAAHHEVLIRRGLSLIGFSVSGLCDDDTVQLTLPLDGHDQDGLDAVLDAVRSRFGPTAIGRATTLGRYGGIEMPTLDDEVTN